MENKLIKWLLSPTKLPSAPPITLIIFICGFCHNAIFGYWWVAIPSLIIILFVKIFQLSLNKYKGTSKIINCLKRVFL